MREKDLDYKARVLDTKSDSFCGAKWYNATIWLGSGMTTSCHHPLPHKIDVEEVKKNPKEMMADMLKYGAVSYWRVGALKDLNIDPDEYCEVSPPKTSLIVRRQQ